MRNHAHHHNHAMRTGRALRSMSMSTTNDEAYDYPVDLLADERAKHVQAALRFQPGTPLTERVLRLARGIAGQNSAAHLRPGEMARRLRVTEEECHAAIEQLADKRVIASDSHPQWICFVPEYIEPTDPAAWQGWQMVARHRHGRLYGHPERIKPTNEDN